jgi:hypothetical protein
MAGHAEQMPLFAIGERETAIPYSTALLKSAIQKAIRRGRADCAASCLKSLLTKDASAAARRLPVILIEDVIAHPDMAKMVTLMRAAGRKPGLTSTEAEWLLRVGVAAAVLDLRDPPRAIHPLRGQPVGELGRLPQREADLIRGMLYRAAAGGLADDRAMLREVAGIWYYRFTEGDWSVARLETTWAAATATAERSSWEAIPFAGPEHILPAAVDFHCIPPIIDWLLAKPEVSEVVAEQFPTRSPAAVLRTVIWVTRAGVNLKPMLGFDRPLRWEQDRPVRWGEGAHDKIKLIGRVIEPHLNDYAARVTRLR